MRVVLNQKHLGLNKKLAKESNKLIKSFNTEKYSKMENIDDILLKRDTSVEKKKSILVRNLHNAILKTFSIDKKKFNKKLLNSLKKRLTNVRRIIIKLRSINYYLESTFLQELKLARIKVKDKELRLKKQEDFAKDELEALEYTTYKLIEEVVMLDKRLVREYASKGTRLLRKEKVETKDLGYILGKQSSVLEHLEAKLPPSKAVSSFLMKEPTFTHWVARIFALLSYLNHLYYREKAVFKKLKKNKFSRLKINKKIIHLMKEKSKLLNIMQEKSISMKKFKVNNELKKELHNFTTIINL